MNHYAYCNVIMMIKEFQPPPYGPFEATVAGSFSGVKLRTIQAWTTEKLLITDKYGRGQRRRYDVLDCIEIGIIATLAEIQIPRRIIRNIMDELRSGTPLTLKEALGSKRAYMIMRWYRSGGYGVSCVNDKYYGPRSGVYKDDDKIDFKQYWLDTTIPEDGEFKKSIIVDLAYIRDEVISKMK